MRLLPLASTLALALGLTAARAVADEDFAGPTAGRRMGPVLGTRRVLAVLWDWGAPGTEAPPAAAIDALLFGEGASMRGWFREVSAGRLTIERAGCVGWVKSRRPFEHYAGPADAEDADGDGFGNGHVEKWTEAIRAAAREVPLAPFDANEDGVLDASELAILVVIPAAGPFGTNRPPAGRELPAWEPLVVQGKTIPMIAEWYTGLPPNLGAPTHELCHLLLGAPDMYHGFAWPFAPGGFSLMDCSYATTHLDPWEKLMLGWLDPHVVDAAGEERELRAVEGTGEALIVWDPARGKGEFFLVEARWREGSYDAGVPGAGGGLAADGLAVWHVLDDPALAGSFEHPAAAGDWGRRALRLVRRNGGAPLDDAQALLSEPGQALRLRWLDGSEAGFTVALLSAPGPRVRVAVRRGG